MIKTTQKKFADVATNIKRAFNKRFWDSANGYYITERPAGYRQTSSLLPVAFGIVPKDKKAGRFGQPEKRHSSPRDYHLNTGLLGTKFILSVLTEAGFGRDRL